jgi:hypothetical protein
MGLSPEERARSPTSTYDREGGIEMSRSRREFLLAAGRLMIALPVGWSVAGAVAGCGSSSSASGSCSNAGKLVTTGTSLVLTSSCDASHTHDFTLMTTELSAPAAAGVMRDTSIDTFDNHAHTVTLSQAELTMIEGGATVTKTTTPTNGHEHTYMFRKA